MANNFFFRIVNTMSKLEYSSNQERKGEEDGAGGRGVCGVESKYKDEK